MRQPLPARAAQHSMAHTHTWRVVQSTAHAYPSIAEQSTNQNNKPAPVKAHIPLLSRRSHTLPRARMYPVLKPDSIGAATVQPKPMLPQNSSQATRVRCQPASQQPLPPPPYCTPLSHPHHHHQHPTSYSASACHSLCVCDTTLGSTGLPKGGRCCMQPYDRDPSTASRQLAPPTTHTRTHTRATSLIHLTCPHQRQSQPVSQPQWGRDQRPSRDAGWVQEMSAALCAGASPLTQSTGEPRQDRHTASQPQQLSSQEMDACMCMQANVLLCTALLPRHTQCACVPRNCTNPTPLLHVLAHARACV